MKIQFSKIREKLEENRIFMGDQNLGKSHPFYTENLIIDVPENLVTEKYTTYWGRNGLNLASLGAFSYTNSVLPANVTVGRYSSIANGLQILGDPHPLEWVSTCPSFYSPWSGLMKALTMDTGKEYHFHKYDKTNKSITIGNDVWIGQNVSLAQGITIGDGSVIAANTLVVKDVPPFSVVGGNPGVLIRKRFNSSIVEEMIELSWWNYDLQDISHLDIDNPSLFCAKLSKMIQKKEILKASHERIIISDLI